MLPLFNYQRAGVEFLTKPQPGKPWPGGCLFDSPGVGKTPQALTAAATLRLPSRPILYLTMAAIKEQTTDEIPLFTELRQVCIKGTPAQRQALWSTPADIYVVNYELLLSASDYRAMLALRPSVIVADEATRLSSITTQTYKALRDLAHTVRPYRIACTGTPLSNTPREIYSVIDWVFPGVLGNWKAWTQRYETYWYNPLTDQEVPGGFKNLDEMATRIAPYYIRRTLEDVAPELPPLTTKSYSVSLSKKERRLYDLIKQELIMEIPPHLLTVSKATLLSKSVNFLRLCQLADSMELVTDSKESSKMKVLLDLTSTITPDKVVIYTKFSQFAELIMRDLPARYKALLLSGDTPNQSAVIKAFQTDPDHQVLVMTDAGAFGLNLQHTCHHIILADMPWSIGKYTQIIGRIRRQGQHFPMFVHELIAHKSVDEQVKRNLLRKLSYEEQVFDITSI